MDRGGFSLKAESESAKQTVKPLFIYAKKKKSGEET
jgi:hypothetical protein